jgi:hypothetical protein
MPVHVKAFHVESPAPQQERSRHLDIPDSIGRFTLQPRPADSKQAVYRRSLTIPPKGRFTLALPSLSGAICDDVDYSMETSPSVRVMLDAGALVFDSDLHVEHNVEVTVSFTMEDGPSRPLGIFRGRDVAK